ncbi:UvrD-helicase domain-containing protein [Chryseolinea sp. T2]|uniref:UvrD-helicase domain-containing protein n=1 Tax=Chryseolinea sp. T2 TaxID=3129255 RepID=UPI0030770FB7
MNPAFSIYRSSAGSGKTRTLAKTYLLLALRYRAEYFKHILAVTFTNKSTQEMKDRILAYLDDFAKGSTNELALELQTELNLDASTFQQYAQDAQAAILHKYDRFAISTIDAFFQKVIRSFTREAGLVGDYRLEVEQDVILEEVIDNLIDELGLNKDLTDWVVEFAKENLENDRAWDVRSSLLDFAQQIFREEFKAIDSELLRTTADRSYFSNLKGILQKEKNNFLARGQKLADEVLKTISDEGWTASDFSFGQNSGLFTFLKGFTDAREVKSVKEPTPRIRTVFTVAEKWPIKSASNPSKIVTVARREFVPRIEALIELYDNEYSVALTSELLLQNLYVFGLIADISRKLAEYKDENNMMLLADAPKFLHGVIQDSDTPYVYEKVGSFYRNYLIDEFQDTSYMQWKNFLPLVSNGLDQGYASMVVGDVKQAIYRWRGGDLKLLQETVGQHVGGERTRSEYLNTNYRSASNIVLFNNRVFNKAAAVAALETGSSLSIDAYRDVEQHVARKAEGYVNIKFLLDSEEKKWKEAAMDRIPEQLEMLQANGVSLRDIAILVRRNDEGQQIVASLLKYRDEGRVKPGFSYEVVSNESLWLDGASSVNLLLAAMRYLLNPEDAIARAQLSYEFARQHAPDRPLEEVFSVSRQAIFEGLLPPAFAQEKGTLKKLPLIELTETLIRIFKLSENQGEIAYLLAFQNLVLEFYSRERNDLAAFLEWWQDVRHKRSVQLPAEINAVQILTVHKSKGLQFKYVIIPFCAWSLDHDNFQSPTLWVKTDEQPFDSLGYMPIRYSSALNQTVFAKDYEEERTRAYLDNLNLLYVALTRAEQGLIVTAPHPSNRSQKKSVASMLHTSISTSFDSDQGWNDLTDELRLGTVAPSENGPVKLQNSVQLKGYPTYPWRDRLVIKKRGSSYFEDTDELQKAGIAYGIHIHAVLSRIRYASEMHDVIAKLVIEGFISHDQATDLLPALDELFSLPKVASWFTDDWEVRTESPILLPSGAENRIDRLLLKNRQAIVIDFKTGSPSRHDQQQVQEYVDVLRKMNYVDVEGYLLYLKSKEIVQVQNGKPKAATKIKDQNQLGLGF